MVRQEILVGVERRRRWSVEEKLRILAEVGIDGAAVSEVARRHELSRQQIYQWRHEMRRRGLGEEEPAVLVPVNVGPVNVGPGNVCPGPARPHGRFEGGCLVEIRLANGRGLYLDGALPEAFLQRLIRIVEGA